VVLRWNELALRIIQAERTPPPLAARNLAIMHAAIYDAVNSIYRTHQAYRCEADAQPGTSPEAAAAVAAHHVLVLVFPRQAEVFNQALDECMADVAEGEGKTAGMLLGQTVAQRLIAWRRRDGAYRQVLYIPGAGPGLWQPTLPAFKPALLPQWPTLTCFCLKNGAQFRPPPPPPLDHAAYATTFQDVKQVGAINSTVRTPEQTIIARFWADDEGTVTPPGHWNRIAQTVAVSKGLSLPECARLFALLNLSLADAGVACWDCKYTFHYWRPVQAIREADPKVNPGTTPELFWTPLLKTPPFPAYTSGHSTFSAAAAKALACFCGTDEVRFVSRSDDLPGIRRTYDSFWAAAEEAGKSRIYGGIHWEFDNREGLVCGRAVADYICRNFLQPR
jgi:hypothetical protein